MGVIAVAWNSLRNQVIPAAASDEQVRECRYAFYAGAQAMHGEVFKAVDSATPEDLLMAIDAEMAAFAESLNGLQEPGPVSDAPVVSAAKELMAITQWMDQHLDMGADRSQVADPAIIARRDIYARVLKRISELQGTR